MGFFIALAGMERGAFFSGGVSCAALRQVFLYRYSKKEEIFFIRCEAKNVYPSKWEASLPGAIMI